MVRVEPEQGRGMRCTGWESRPRSSIEWCPSASLRSEWRKILKERGQRPHGVSGRRFQVRGPGSMESQGRSVLGVFRKVSVMVGTWGSTRRTTGAVGLFWMQTLSFKTYLHFKRIALTAVLGTRVELRGQLDHNNSPDGGRAWLGWGSAWGEAVILM